MLIVDLSIIDMERVRFSPYIVAELACLDCPSILPIVIKDTITTARCACGHIIVSSPVGVIGDKAKSLLHEFINEHSSLFSGKSVSLFYEPAATPPTFGA